MRKRIEDFIKFAKSKCIRTRIDHEKFGDRGPWCKCAVGDFLPIENYPDTTDLTDFCIELRCVLPHTYGKLEASKTATYGELVNDIANELLDQSLEH